METVAPIQEIIDVIKASGGEAFKLCYQCGLCDTVCPWNRVRSFSMRKIIREATFGLTDIETEEMWRCTTCGNCPRQCPRGVKIIEAGVSLRRISTEYGVFPTPVSPVRGVAASPSSISSMSARMPFTMRFIARNLTPPIWAPSAARCRFNCTLSKKLRVWTR